MSTTEQKTPTPKTEELQKKEEPEQKKEEPEQKEEPVAKAACENNTENSNVDAVAKTKEEEEAKRRAEEAKKIKQRMEKETIIIKSSFSNNQGMLGDDGYPDVSIGFADCKEILRAHRSVLSKRSKTMEELFRGQKVDAHCIYDAEANRIQWDILGKDKETGQTALFQCIKFCYGAELCVNPMNAAATIDALFRLKLVGGKDIQNRIEQHMVTVAGNDVESGSLMLRHCAEYEKAGSSGFTKICLLLAKTVLTSGIIEKHREIVVDNCLMQLAPVYLDRADFGNPHKGFSLRKEYVMKHKGVLSDTELRDVICKCQFESMTNDELKEMRNLHNVTKGVTESVVLDAYNKAMSDCETRLAQEQKRAEQAEAVVRQCEFIIQHILPFVLVHHCFSLW